MIAYESEVDGGESHVALVRGPIGEEHGRHSRRWFACTRTAWPAMSSAPPPATAESMLERSLERIAQEGRGALIYLHNTSRGFELDRREAPPRIVAAPRDCARREMHPDPIHEERHQRILRQVGLGGQILADLDIRKIRLLSNTPTHVPALEGFDLEIVEQVPILDQTLAFRRHGRVSRKALWNCKSSD